MKGPRRMEGRCGELRGADQARQQGAYSVSCWVRCGYRHGRFPIVHIHHGNGANAQAKPDPEPNSIQPSRARPALIALTVGVVPSIPNQRGVNPKRTWRQTQAGVAPNPNPCQLYPLPF
jgi:hypothetical protein